MRLRSAVAAFGELGWNASGGPDHGGTISGEIVAEVQLVGRIGAGDHGNRGGEVVVSKALDGLANERGITSDDDEVETDRTAELGTDGVVAVTTIEDGESHRLKIAAVGPAILVVAGDHDAEHRTAVANRGTEQRDHGIVTGEALLGKRVGKHEGRAVLHAAIGVAKTFEKREPGAR